MATTPHKRTSYESESINSSSYSTKIKGTFAGKRPPSEPKVDQQDGTKNQQMVDGNDSGHDKQQRNGRSVAAGLNGTDGNTESDEDIAGHGSRASTNDDDENDGDGGETEATSVSPSSAPGTPCRPRADITNDGVMPSSPCAFDDPPSLVPAHAEGSGQVDALGDREELGDLRGVENGLVAGGEVEVADTVHRLWRARNRKKIEDAQKRIHFVGSNPRCALATANGGPAES